MIILYILASIPFSIIPALLLGKYKMHINIKIGYTAIVLLTIQIIAAIVYIINNN